MEAKAEDKRELVFKLFVTHRSMLSAYAYSFFGNWELSEDALQDAATYLFEHWEDYIPDSSFTAWSRSVIRLRCLEIVRREKKQKNISAGLAIQVEDHLWEESFSFENKKLEALRHCLDQSSNKFKELLELHYVKKMTCSQISKIVKKSQESIYMMMSRARSELRGCIEGKIKSNPQGLE